MIRPSDAEESAARIAAIVVAAKHEGVLESVERPDKVERSTAAVDLRFRVGTQRFALEHTVVEAFEGDLHYSERFNDFFEPLLRQLQGKVVVDSQIDIIVEIDAVARLARADVADIQAALVRWILLEGPALPLGRDPFSSPSRISATPPGVPFAVTLARDTGNEGLVFAARIAPDDLDVLRRARVERALARKCVKLAAEEDRGATTVLALELTNLALDNGGIIFHTVKEIFSSTTHRVPALLVLVDARMRSRGGEATVTVYERQPSGDYDRRRFSIWRVRNEEVRRLSA